MRTSTSHAYPRNFLLDFDLIGVPIMRGIALDGVQRAIIDIRDSGTLWLWITAAEYTELTREDLDNPEYAEQYLPGFFDHLKSLLEIQAAIESAEAWQYNEISDVWEK